MLSTHWATVAQVALSLWSIKPKGKTKWNNKNAVHYQFVAWEQQKTDAHAHLSVKALIYHPNDNHFLSDSININTDDFIPESLTYFNL